MITYLPESGFLESVIQLDRRIAFISCLDARKILIILGVDGIPPLKSEVSEIDKSWILDSMYEHPSVLMWKGYEQELIHYYNVFLDYCKWEYHVNTELTYMNCKYSQGELINNQMRLVSKNELVTPSWVKCHDIIKSHRSRLIMVNFSRYYSLYPEEIRFNDGCILYPNQINN